MDRGINDGICRRNSTLNIVTPDQSLSYEVDEVAMPGQEGDFGVLPGHTPLFAGLRTGTMWYRQGSEKHFLAVSVGFAEVLPDRVTVLAQVAERAEDLDEARAQAGMARAEEMMQARAGGDRLRARAAVAAPDAAAAAGRIATRRRTEAIRLGSARTFPIPDPMLRNLRALVRYRGLIQTLVARDLKARYRGSVLGFFWSFINPLLLLLIYSFVFTTVLPRAAHRGLRAVRAVHVLRHPAVDLVFLVDSRIVERADLGRQPDQEGAVSRPKCCPSSPCSRTWCTSFSGCRSSRRS